MKDSESSPHVQLGERLISGINHARLLASQVNMHADAVASYAALLDQEPGLVTAWLELGNLLKRTKQYDLALSCYNQVMILSPELAEPYLRSAEIFGDRGMLEEARRSFSMIPKESLSFGMAVQSATLLPVITKDIDEIESIRKRILADLELIESTELPVGNPLESGRVFFYLTYQGYNDIQFQKKLASLYFAAYPDLTWVAPHCTAGQQQVTRGKIRIAFVSRFFCEHTIAKLNRGLIAHLSRQLFEVHVFHLGRYDRMSEQIKNSADHFTCCSEDLTEIRSAIAAWEPDIVYYTDIGMEPLTYFLAFSRLAPLQCVTWGHPVTTGIPAIDRFISHELCELGCSREFYTERLLCLGRERALTYYYRPELPAMTKSRPDFRLPVNGHIYACLQSIFKVHPDFDAILAGILTKDPQGYIVFIQGGIPEHENLIRQRLSLLIPDHNERIIFVPKMSEDEYLNLIDISDVLLDTIHFGGGNSSAEAFAVGTPIVTLPSPYLRGRLTYAWYKRMGFMDCVAETSDEYVSIAVRLGVDKEFRSYAKEKIGMLSSALYEDMGVVRETESLLIEALSQRRNRIAE